MPDFVNTSTQLPSEATDLTQLQSQLESGSEKMQLQALAQLIAADVPGQQVIQSFLQSRQQQGLAVTFVEGRAYELLLQVDRPEVQSFLAHHFTQGVVSLRSEAGIDYEPLQQRLAAQDFLEADRLTLQKLCELAGDTAIRRKWVYFTEVESFPAIDLQTIDALWSVHSEGKFGFRVQRQLWLSVGKNWDILWPKINWKADKAWTRYPDGFTWDLSAPRGHLPLSNQLRGVQTFNALLNHPAWTT
ncbi:GUN4 domain-containing protein [Synechococcales cyanobacterium C]|uniref:GUN4 domain-containing protein n=1 Tax=Petrachloros mirabilis ULC683 TaxID=2781853 RepID=A0A8K2A716_9CYAN|nr:GUN4 domain-containing protein [Petrachloros mirabilis]NCJ05650.1 GUN4 domain-containing protein [Petrachloros mirabilis ULC683]